MTTDPLGLSASNLTTFAFTCLTSILLPSIQTSPVGPTAIRIAAFSCVSAVSESGLFISRPGSLIKFAVTIKNMSMMNTTSSMGVKFISLSSSLTALLIAFLLIYLSYNSLFINSLKSFVCLSDALPKYMLANTPDRATTIPAIVGRVAFETPPAIALASPPPLKAIT